MPNDGERKYRPGSKNPKFRSDGRMSENRFAWLRVVIGQFVIMHYEDDDGLQPYGEEETDSNEHGPTVRLVLPRMFGAPIKYNITALTLDELMKLREFFNLLFDLAEPTVRERDRIAHEALEAGDDSFARVYRQVPQFIVRGRSGRANGKGIHDGHEDAAAGPAVDLSPTGAAGTDGGTVADDDAQGDVAQDDHATAD